MMAFCSTAVQAQDKPQDNQSKKQRMTREQMAEAQAKHIAHDLALDDATSQKLVKTFCDYQKEVWALGAAKRNKKKAEEMTDAEVEQSIKARMERSQKILDLREKYYKEYNKFLTPKQIQRVYDLEQQTIKRLGRGGQMGKRPQMGGKRSQMGKRPHPGKPGQPGKRTQRPVTQQQHNQS